jgi:hypothetical protein
MCSFFLSVALSLSKKEIVYVCVKIDIKGKCMQFGSKQSQKSIEPNLLT